MAGVNFWVGTVSGFLLANVLNFIEIGILIRLMRDIKSLLHQLKQEGNKDKWLE